jgi:hypothetical protein
MRLKVGSKIINVTVMDDRPEPVIPLVSRTVDNTYEAAYYMCAGGRVTSVRTRKTANNSKKGFHYQWIIEMDNIPENRVELWRLGHAKCQVRELQAQRTKLKRMVKKTYER